MHFVSRHPTMYLNLANDLPGRRRLTDGAVVWANREMSGRDTKLSNTHRHRHTQIKQIHTLNTIHSSTPSLLSGAARWLHILAPGGCCLVLPKHTEVLVTEGWMNVKYVTFNMVIIISSDMEKNRRKTNPAVRQGSAGFMGNVVETLAPMIQFGVRPPLISWVLLVYESTVSK